MFPLVFVVGWASGFNPYLVVLMLGAAQRLGIGDTLPAALGETWVLALSGALTLVHIITDKIPYLDSGWDAIHTFIRPLLGAALGALLTGESSDWESALSAATGGTVALAAHAAKATTRLGVNSSPEPFSNVLISTFEDVSVAGVLTVAIVYPWVGLALALVALVVGVLLALVVWRTGRKLHRNLRSRMKAVRSRTIIFPDPPT